MENFYMDGLNGNIWKMLREQIKTWKMLIGQIETNGKCYVGRLKHENVTWTG